MLGIKKERSEHQHADNIQLEVPVDKIFLCSTTRPHEISSYNTKSLASRKKNVILGQSRSGNKTVLEAILKLNELTNN